MISFSRRDVFPVLAGSLALALAGAGCRGEELGGAKPADKRPAQHNYPALDAGLLWLLAQQAPNGTFPSATYGLLKSGESLTPAILLALLDASPLTSLNLRPALEAGLAFLSAVANSEGAIGFSGTVPDYPVYATAMTVHAAARVRGAGDLGAFERSLDWLAGQQLTLAKGWSTSPAAGGWPMGRRMAPVPPQAGHVDLSMTRRALQAFASTATLRSGSGERRNDRLASAARADALAFVERSQTRDGGFVYSTANPGLNKAGAGTGYGSATCDGLLALAALGVPREDPRVERGLSFLRRIHRTDRNPGLAGSPFAAFAVAMKGYYRAASSEVFARWGWPEGAAAAMVDAVLKDQSQDGSWRSSEVLQKEDDPLISTAFALQALAGALQKPASSSLN